MLVLQSAGLLWGHDLPPCTAAWKTIDLSSQAPTKSDPITSSLLPEFRDHTVPPAAPWAVVERSKTSRQIMMHHGYRRMIRSERLLAPLNGTAVQRQRRRRVAKTFQATRQIDHGGERLGMLLAQHPLAPLNGTTVQRQRRRRVAKTFQAARQIVHAS